MVKLFSNNVYLIFDGQSVMIIVLGMSLFSFLFFFFQLCLSWAFLFHFVNYVQGFFVFAYIVLTAMFLLC